MLLFMFLINIAVYIDEKINGFIKLGYWTIWIKKTDMLLQLEKLCKLKMAGYMLNKGESKHAIWII